MENNDILLEEEESSIISLTDENGEETMLHSSAMSRRDGKQLSLFLSLCLSKQQ